MQLFALPTPWRTLGVLRVRSGSDRRTPREYGRVHLGDKTLRNVRCKACGCATHWEPLVPEPGGKHGVNLNNFDPRLQELVQVRHFDGADTWKFID